MFFIALKVTDICPHCEHAPIGETISKKVYIAVG